MGEQGLEFESPLQTKQYGAETPVISLLTALADKMAQTPQVVTLAQLAEHNTKDDLWVAVHGKGEENDSIFHGTASLHSQNTHDAGANKAHSVSSLVLCH